MGRSFFKSCEYKDYIKCKNYYLDNRCESNFRIYFYSIEKVIDLAKSKYNNIGWNGNSYNWVED